MHMKRTLGPMIKTKTLAATATLGKRIKAVVINRDGTTGARATYPWDNGASAHTNHRHTAWRVCKSAGWDHDWMQGTLSTSPLVCVFIVSGYTPAHERVTIEID